MSNRVTWGDGAYAGFWLRVAARLIDALIAGAVLFVLAVVFTFVMALAVLSGDEVGLAEPGPVAGFVFTVLLWIAAFLPDFLYDTVMTSRLGWTVGKRAVGIEVRSGDGERLSFPRAALRYVGRFVSAIPLGLGFLWVLWDPRKQTWHDKFANSFVVMSSRVVVPGTAPGAPRPWGGQGGWGIPGAARPGGEPVRDAPAAGATGGVVTSAWPGGTADFELDKEPEPVRDAPSPAPDQGPAVMEAPADAGTPEHAGWARELDWNAPEPVATEVEAAEVEAPEAPEEPVEAAVAEREPVTEAEPEARPDDGVPATGEAYVAPVADDPNLVAVGRAGLPGESATWLEQVAGQVDSRLDRVAGQWRSAPHAEAARACAFGLLLGHLAVIYPHMEQDLSRVAETHPSFSTLAAGSRLTTLRQIVEDPRRAAAWIGPLVGVTDPDQVRRLLD